MDRSANCFLSNPMRDSLVDWLTDSQASTVLADSSLVDWLTDSPGQHGTSWLQSCWLTRWLSRPAQQHGTDSLHSHEPRGPSDSFQWLAGGATRCQRDSLIFYGGFIGMYFTRTLESPASHAANSTAPAQGFRVKPRPLFSPFSVDFWRFMPALDCKL